MEQKPYKVGAWSGWLIILAAIAAISVSAAP